MMIPFDKAIEMLEQGKSLILQIDADFLEVKGSYTRIPTNVYETQYKYTEVTRVIKSSWTEKGSRVKIQNYNSYKAEFVPTPGRVFFTKAIEKQIPKIEQLRKNKKPSNKRSNYVGVEMEMCTKLTDIELTDLLISNKLDRFCTISGDGSIDTTAEHEYDLELKILAKESEIEKVITKVCKLLNKDDRASTNDSCGLHVHLDMRNRKVEESFKKLYEVQDKMETFVDDTRLDNDYCMRNTVPRYSYYANGSSRYYTINATAYKKFKTLEVRLHDGTLNSTRINKWIKFLLTTVKQKSKVSKPVKQKAA